MFPSSELPSVLDMFRLDRRFAASGDVGLILVDRFLFSSVLVVVLAVSALELLLVVMSSGQPFLGLPPIILLSVVLPNHMQNTSVVVMWYFFMLSHDWLRRCVLC